MMLSVFLPEKGGKGSGSWRAGCHSTITKEIAADYHPLVQPTLLRKMILKFYCVCELRACGEDGGS